ncbi:MAG: sulfotransferase family 2 domain-containing protein [Bacteroidota bacterium]
MLPRFFFRFLQRIRRTQLAFLIRWHLFNGKRIVHFIHIGKTGGTAVKHVFGSKISFHKHCVLIAQNHRFRLFHSEPGEKFCFVVRDPIDRFVSGFYSRMRQGRPANNNPWRPEEARAFSIFQTPNELGLALSSEDQHLRSQAVEAMRAIGHVKSSYWDWFKDLEFWNSRRDDLVLVLRQENLQEDFELLKKKLKIDLPSLPPKHQLAAHATPVQYDKQLSSGAVKNLKQWYQAEYDFLKMLIDQDLLPTTSY